MENVPQEKKKPSTGMKWLVGVGVVCALICAKNFLQYGAVTPCGILKVKVHRKMNEVLTARAGTSGMGVLGAAVGMKLATALIDTRIDTLDSFQCLSGLDSLPDKIGSMGAGGQEKDRTDGGSTSPQRVRPTVPTPDPIHLSGHGQDVTKKFILAEGLSIIEMTHNGDSNFSPQLLNADGSQVERLANEIGMVKGSKAVHVPKDGQYLIDVSADGSWAFNISQPRPTTAPQTKTFKGRGFRTTEIFSLSSGLAIFKMHHGGQGNWSPLLMDADGNHVERLANEIGIFDGSKAVHINESGLYVLDVSADGPWTILVQ